MRNKKREATKRGETHSVLFKREKQSETIYIRRENQPHKKSEKHIGHRGDVFGVPHIHNMDKRKRANPERGETEHDDNSNLVGVLGVGHSRAAL